MLSGSERPKLFRWSCGVAEKVLDFVPVRVHELLQVEAKWLKHGRVHGRSCGISFATA
jgi:hypothetical protein